MDCVGFIITNGGNISAQVAGKSYVIARDHKNYQEVVQALQDGDVEAFKKFVDIAPQVQTWGAGHLTVQNGGVFFKGEEIHGTIVPRVMDHFQQGISVEYLANFLERLSQNPSNRAVTELYEFLDHRGLPITKTGTFLAYKGVRFDSHDRYSGTIKNEVGATIEVPRNRVDDDRTRTCSHGLHLGTIDYVVGYCTEKVLVVEVDPADVVSVPTDHDAQKCRVCRYKVVGEYDGELVRKNQPIETPVCDDYLDEEDDFEPDDEEEDWEDEDSCPECGDPDCGGDCQDDEDIPILGARG